MSSMPMQNSTPQLEETIQGSVHQIGPCAWRAEAGQKEAFGFCSVRPQHVRKSTVIRWRIWSSLR